jgi:thiol-disulfide isomerase/thioredoxin
MSQEFAESSGIVKLNPSVLSIRNNMPFTIHNELQHKRPYFLVFYAKWCGYCKLLSPIMEALAQKYRNMRMHKPVAAIDCAEHKLNTSFGNVVTGYPTIFSVKGSSCKRYTGERSVEAFDSHLNERERESEPESSNQSEKISSSISNLPPSPKVKSANKSKKTKKARKAKKSSKSSQSGGKHIFNRMRSFRR